MKRFFLLFGLWFVPVLASANTSVIQRDYDQGYWKTFSDTGTCSNSYGDASGYDNQHTNCVGHGFCSGSVGGPYTDSTSCMDAGNSCHGGSPSCSFYTNNTDCTNDSFLYGGCSWYGGYGYSWVVNTYTSDHLWSDLTTAGSAAGKASYSGAFLQVLAFATDTAEVERGAIWFPVQHYIPSGSTATGATLCQTIYVTDDSDSLALTDTNLVSSGSLALSDYSQLPDSSTFPPTELATRITSTDIGGAFGRTLVCYTFNSNGLSALNADISAEHEFVPAYRAHHDVDNVASFPHDSEFYLSDGYQPMTYGYPPELTVYWEEGVSSSSSSSGGSSSSAISCSGSGCALSGSGSLIIANSYCDSYDPITDGSGSVIGEVCTSWTHTIKIPFLKWLTDLIMGGGYSSIILLVSLFVIMFLFVKPVMVFFWRLFTFQKLR